MSIATEVCHQDYADDSDDEVVSQSIRAIGTCAYLIPDCTQQCLTALIAMIKSSHGSEFVLFLAFSLLTSR